MAPLLQSATTASGGDAVVTVRGDIDTETAGQLWEYLSFLVGQGHRHIVLDLRGLILIDSTGVEVLARFDPIPRVKARQAEVDQVFVNLISNAVQAMDGKGRLTLATSESRDAVTASVSDTGSGIPKSVMGKIFDPFFTTKDPGKGTGLGLSIAYKIVSKYGGTIHVESEEGKGSKFTIQFPVAHA